jgi:hypothetical protein
MADQIISQEYLREIFDYKDGNLYWKKTTSPRSLKGNKAGSKNKDGYYQVNINRKKYYVHRLIFMLHFNYLPKFLDHIDLNKSNNKIENLREASNQQNSFNKKIDKRNTSGYKNIYWNKKNKKWIAALMINGKTKHIGCYEDIEVANQKAIQIREFYANEFARHE